MSDPKLKLCKHRFHSPFASYLFLLTSACLISGAEEDVTIQRISSMPSGAEWTRDLKYRSALQNCFNLPHQLHELHQLHHPQYVQFRKETRQRKGKRMVQEVSGKVVPFAWLYDVTVCLILFANYVPHKSA